MAKDRDELDRVIGELEREQEVSAQAVVLEAAIARLEAGLADPKLSTLARYAAALGFELHFSWQGAREPVSDLRRPVPA
jgi:predicted transcriptional regulator